MERFRTRKCYSKVIFCSRRTLKTNFPNKPILNEPIRNKNAHLCSFQRKTIEWKSMKLQFLFGVVWVLSMSQVAASDRWSCPPHHGASNASFVSYWPSQGRCRAVSFLATQQMPTRQSEETHEGHLSLSIKNLMGGGGALGKDCWSLSLNAGR